MNQGVIYQLDQIRYEEKHLDLVETLEFANYKGVDKNIDWFEDMMLKTDVIHGYSLVVILRD